MARPLKIISTRQMTLTMNRNLHSLLVKAVKTGLFGSSPSEACKIIISEEIRKLRRSGLL